MCLMAFMLVLTMLIIEAYEQCLYKLTGDNSHADDDDDNGSMCCARIFATLKCVGEVGKLEEEKPSYFQIISPVRCKPKT